MTERTTKTNKHQVMIFLQGENYNKLKDLVEKRKISRFINELIEEKLQETEKKEKQKLKQQLIKDYQAVARSQKRKAEDEI